MLKARRRSEGDYPAYSREMPLSARLVSEISLRKLQIANCKFDRVSLHHHVIANLFLDHSKTCSYLNLAASGLCLGEMTSRKVFT
jgi:hypothetical protein